MPTQQARCGKTLAGTLLILLASGLATASAANITQITPREASRGEVLTVLGDFTPQQGNQDVYYSPKIDGHRRPGRTNMRVVSWSPTAIQVQVPVDLPAAESYALWVISPDARSGANWMSFTLKGPAPPVVRGGDFPMPRLDSVHPDTARPGGEVDVYGDFQKPPNARPRIILVNLHGVPVERYLETVFWTDRRARIRVPDGLMGGDFRVFVRWTNILDSNNGQMHARESNRLQLVIRTTAEDGWERGRPHILAIEPPGEVRAGSVVDILGEDFGEQGRKKIAITPFRYHPLNEASDRPPLLDVISWSDVRIRARLPADLPRNEYFLFIYWSRDYEDRSNALSLRVIAAGGGGGGSSGILPFGAGGPAGGGGSRNPAPPAEAAGGGTRPQTVPFVTNSDMTIERVTFLHQADSRIMLLSGRRFGTVQGQKIVSLNRQGTRQTAQVVSWSDREVRVRVPAGLPVGEYRVLVYYDRSLATSSNSQQVRLGADPPPPARGRSG